MAFMRVPGAEVLLSKPREGALMTGRQGLSQNKQLVTCQPTSGQTPSVNADSHTLRPEPKGTQLALYTRHWAGDPGSSGHFRLTTGHSRCPTALRAH